MAGAGYRNWTAGDIPTATQFDTFLQEQTVMVFATAAARNAALAAVLAEGMVTFQVDTNTLTVYSGAAWSTVGPLHGALTAWTPTVTQSGAVTVTNTSSSYQRIGRQVTCRFFVTVTGAGTGANAVIVAGLPFTGLNTGDVVGVCSLLDSGSNRHQAHIRMESTTTLSLLASASTALDPRLGVTSFTAALAAGDTISGTFTYQVAADA